MYLALTDQDSDQLEGKRGLVKPQPASYENLIEIHFDS